jgi:accessory gene regulator protein AgrB
MKGTPAVAGLLLLALVFVILAVLYALGSISWLASTTGGPHYKHAIVMLILAVLAGVAANFARNRAPA